MAVRKQPTREIKLGYEREYRAEKRVQIRKRKRDWERRVHDETLAHYGGACACCEEAMPEFLWLYPGRGISMPEGYGSLALRLRKLGYPEGFRVFCRNCGPLIERGGCPHRHGAI